MRHYGPKIVRDLKRPRLWLVIALVGFALSRPIIGWSSYWTIWLETIFGSTIVALLAFGPFGSPSSAPLRAIRFLGKVSFSFYLLSPVALLLQQSLVNESLSPTINAGFHPLVLCAALFCCEVAFTTLLAWLQFNLIERPGIMIGRTVALVFRSLPRRSLPLRESA
jgi:peptidoglycan/LPS O-acetylase OafA/YrhL